MIDKITNLSGENFSTFLLLSSFAFLGFAMFIAVFLKAIRGYGLEFKIYNNNKGSFVNPKKATAKEKRNAWIITAVAFIIFLGLIVVITNANIWN